jgi:hypothetical protein
MMKEKRMEMTYNAYSAQRKFLNSMTESPTKTTGLSSEEPSATRSPGGKGNMAENEE